MILINTFLYYICFASAIMIYGIGANETVDFSLSKLKNVTYISKIIISIVLSSVISWFVTNGILVPLKMVELYPVVCFLIYICINTFMEALIRLTTGKSTSEFIFSYLVILLSICESTSLVNTVIISASCLISFILLIPFVFAFKKRNSGKDVEQYYSRYFLYIALLILVVSVWDIMWINPEVIK